ncbi:MAG: hypothetical protein LAP87_02100 [Acidobacteriia bacterium]|nr:hypothetical protein [Terriglobia bacterium]
MTLTITPDVPAVAAGGVLNAASNATGQPVAPGSLVSIYGSHLADALIQASSVPLLTKLGNTSVTFNGIAAPLCFVSSGQINAQVPWEVTGSTADMVVTNGGAPSAPVSVPLTTAGPGIFVTGSQAIAYGNWDYVFAAAPGAIPGLITHPARIRDPATLVILATGLGPVDLPVETGNSAPIDGILRRTVTTPVVKVGGVQAQVVFSGMSTYVGVYQINIVIQPGTPTGDAVPLTITMNGITSNAPTIAVSND